MHSATHPLALFLCTSSYEVISVQSLCKSFLRTSNNIRSVAAFNGKSDKSVAVNLFMFLYRNIQKHFFNFFDVIIVLNR